MPLISRFVRPDTPKLRQEQAARIGRGETWQLGIGICSYVEVTGWGSEFASVEADDQGTFTVLTGTSPQGQGHETAWAQIVADTLGVSFDAVTVRHSDTLLVPRGEGTMGSRSLQVGGSAVLRASVALLDKARRLAAHLLETSESDVRSFDGRIGVGGDPESSLSWGELAAAAATPHLSRPVWRRGCGRRTTSRWRIRPIRSVPTSRSWRSTPRRGR